MPPSSTLTINPTFVFISLSLLLSCNHRPALHLFFYSLQQLTPFSSATFSFCSYMLLAVLAIRLPPLMPSPPGFLSDHRTRASPSFLREAFIQLTPWVSGGRPTYVTRPKPSVLWQMKGPCARVHVCTWAGVTQNWLGSLEERVKRRALTEGEKRGKREEISENDHSSKTRKRDESRNAEGRDKRGHLLRCYWQVS